MKAAMRELAAALAVIAVFALTFVYQPYLPTILHQDGVRTLVSSAIICGDIGDQGHADHGPCHACREKPAILPPPSDIAAPAYGRFIAVVYAVTGETALRPIRTPHYNPRAPPFAV
ncbi:hypothetical protein TM49_00235 [Martelella endophytica]|uniref:Uncharacterized protein n=2 Tax=Martelella endophytica TaxID=1486262 RepID=A0A0D5LMD4_MAREN|nr:hypothetical protein TM49_00235 [Martelella endophytica]